MVARASYFLVRGRLQNNHKRGLAIVAENVLDLEEILARRRACEAQGRAGAIPAPTAPSVPASGGDGRSCLPAGHPESVHPLHRREAETYGDGTISAKKRPPGAGTTAIPKKVG